MYGWMGWQGSQAYNSSAKSAHEAKMGQVLGNFRGMPQATFMLFVPIVIYVFMNHPDYVDISNSVKASLNKLDSETLKTQLRAFSFSRSFAGGSTRSIRSFNVSRICYYS